MFKIFKKHISFAPCMPAVDVHSDIATIFAEARSKLSRRHPKDRTRHPCIGVVAPDRTVAFPSTNYYREAPEATLAVVRSILPSNQPLNITGVAFTGLGKLKARDLDHVPSLSVGLWLDYIGHNVVVFEGHESGFEGALRGADALLIDSGMLPFLQANWFDVAQGVFRRKGRIRVANREWPEGYRAVVKAKTASGWDYATANDGELSYANALLATLGKRSPIRVELREGEPLPNPATLATELDEIERTSMLPFQYDALNAEEVIRIIASSGGEWSSTRGSRAVGTLKRELIDAAGKSAGIVTFQLLLTDDEAGKGRLQIERLS